MEGQRGRGGTFPCPLRKRGGRAPTFRSSVLFLREGEGGAPFRGSGPPACSVLKSCLRNLFLQEWGLGAKGVGAPARCAGEGRSRCALKRKERMTAVEVTCARAIWHGQSSFNLLVNSKIRTSVKIQAPGYLRVCSQRRIQTWIRGNPAPKRTWTRGSNYLRVFPRVYLQVTCVDLDPRSALCQIV